MQPDSEGFVYPKVEASSCTRCGLCVSSCPVRQIAPFKEPLGVYAAYAEDDRVRLAASSGGIFPLLAEYVLSRGGVVYGAVVRESNCEIEHIAIESVAELHRLTGSKYVQSNASRCFPQIRKHLDLRRIVLFSGTPCQAAGLKTFLGREYEHLYIVDLICHAVASPLAWNRYLSIASKGRMDGMSKDGERKVIPSTIRFRDKVKGWRWFSMSYSMLGGGVYSRTLDKDPFLRGFIVDLFNRPSCHSCAYRGAASQSDITLGDYWRIQDRFPDMDDDKGCSLILVSTHKGLDLLKLIRDRLAECRECSYMDAVYSTGALVASPKPHRKRKEFFKRVETDDFDVLVERLLKRPLFVRLYWRVGVAIKGFLRKMRLVK